MWALIRLVDKSYLFAIPFPAEIVEEGQIFSSALH